jgi:acyl carrier protein
MADYLNEIKKVISHKAGVELSEVTKESFFEDDLNIGEMELIEILEELEEKYHTDLVEERENIISVNDLLDIMSEKLD